jgi:RNA polymerase sigma-70 factor, ECF subfamily
VTDPDGLARFEAERPRLLRIAHRMLGSASEAEDVVQSAWLRWADTDRDAVTLPAAWLTRTVSRLALDLLKSAPRRHEVYVGPWLPEPLVEEDEPGDADDLTTALLLALERLSPLERAAFLLHDVFDMDFTEVAKTLDRDEAACRQLASRARKHVAEARPRYTIPVERQRETVAAFFTASRTGDAGALAALLAEDALLLSDGGGIRPAIAYPLVGRDLIVTAYKRLARVLRDAKPSSVRFAWIDGLPGIVSREADGMLQTMALQIGPSGIEAVYVQRNPEKLRHLEG